MTRLLQFVKNGFSSEGAGKLRVELFSGHPIN